MKSVDDVLVYLKNHFTARAEEVNGTALADAVMKRIYGDNALFTAERPLFASWVVSAAAACLAATGGMNLLIFRDLTDSLLLMALQESLNPLSLNDLAGILFF